MDGWLECNRKKKVPQKYSNLFIVNAISNKDKIWAGLKCWHILTPKIPDMKNISLLHVTGSHQATSQEYNVRASCKACRCASKSQLAGWNNIRNDIANGTNILWRRNAWWEEWKGKEQIKMEASYHFKVAAANVPVIIYWLLVLFSSISGTTSGKSVQHTCALKIIAK